ncbi:MAG: cytochrome c [Pyrinomonadaceae bacterium]
MKSIKLALFTALVTLFAIACSNTPTDTTSNTGGGAQPSPTLKASPTPTPDEFAKTREVYKQNCAICHQPTGDGGLVEIEKVKLKVPSLKAGHALKHTDEQFAKQITNGGEGMPPFKEKLKKEEIADLVRFIRKDIQAGAAASAPTNPPASTATPAAPKKS